MVSHHEVTIVENSKHGLKYGNCGLVVVALCEEEVTIDVKLFSVSEVDGVGGRHLSEKAHCIRFRVG
jgi:hypothetical protein